MSNRDIFDEELDKINQQGDPFDDWSTYSPQPPTQPKRKKPLSIILISVAMVVCLALGWVLCTVFTPSGSSYTPGNDQRKDILSQLVDTMDYYFYDEISEKQWQDALEKAGSALTDAVGDEYSMLMSPQTYYDYYNNVSNTKTAATSANELFGMTYQMEYSGMLITSVAEDSVCYGNLYAGDLIVKLDNIQEYQPILSANGEYKFTATGALAVLRDSNGKPITKSPSNFSILPLKGFNSEEGINQIANYLSFVYSATFHVLRMDNQGDFSILPISLQRNKVGIQDTPTANKMYDLSFVEYYFGDDKTNLSVTQTNGASVSTKELRNLSSLPSDTGYVRLIEFNGYTVEENGTKVTHSAYTELKRVMQLFKNSGLKYLVLDLKGNPGGDVRIASDVAGLLIHSGHLDQEQRATVTKDGKLLVTTLIDKNGNHIGGSPYLVQSSYYNYFPQEASTKKNIVVWTDGSSASASELLTGTLLDYKTAVHMGADTFGKGIAQTIIPLDIQGTVTTLQGTTMSYPWAVYYTCAKYYSPFGKNIHGEGYKTSTQIYDYATLWQQAKNYWGI